MLKKNEHITHLELNNNVIDYAVTEAGRGHLSFSMNDISLYNMYDVSSSSDHKLVLTGLADVTRLKIYPS
jgi:hypothetical protein